MKKIKTCLLYTSAFEGTGDTENKLTEQFYRSKNITTNLMVTYNTKIGKHSIGGLLGLSLIHIFILELQQQ